MARFNIKTTLTPGTPLRVATVFGFSLASPIYCDRVSIQMATKAGGSSGLGYVMDGILVTVTPDKTNAAHVAAQLAAAGTTAPGGQYVDHRDPSDGAGIDIRELCIDGDQADPVIFSVNRRV